MALTKVTYGLLSADTSAIDLNIDANTLYVDSSANRVGIGTTSPAGDLHVVGATGSAGRIYVADADNGTTATDSLLLTKSGNTAFVYNRESSGDLQLGAGDTAGHVVIKSSGEVGIGTSTPAKALQVKTDTNGDGVNIQRNSTTEGHYGQLSFSISTNDTYTTPNTWIRSVRGSSYSNNFMTFGTGGNTGTERMRIDSSGNIGIGTTSPNQWASYTDSAATVLQVRDTSERARVVINGGNGAHLDLVDYAGSTNDKHMNIQVDGGVLKFGSLNDAGNAFVQNNILIMDLGTGAIKFNNAYTFPTSDGSANQVLQTDGSGALSFATVSGLPLSGGTLTGALQITSAKTQSGGAPIGNLLIADSTSLAANVGGGITFQGVYHTGGNITGLASIEAMKETATHNQYGGALVLKTRQDQGAMAERMRIDSSGRVGIGLTPNATTNFALDIQATSGGNALRLKGRSAGGNEGWLAWTDNSDNVEAAMYATANNLIFANTTSYTERMRIDSSGNVGIGTSSPSHLLELVRSSTDFGATLEINNTNSANGSVGAMRFVTENESTGLMIGKHSSGHGTADFAFINQELNADLGIFTNNSEKMRIHSSGCVGIGSTVDRSIGTGIGTLVINGTGGGGLWLSDDNQSSTTSKIYAANNGSVGELIINNGAGVGSGGIIIKTNENEKMRILSDGSVLVNTTVDSDNQTMRIAQTGSNADPALALSSDTGDQSYYRYIKFYRKGQSGSVAKLDIDWSGSSIGLAFTSDARLKTVTGEADGLELITRLNPVKYVWKSEPDREGAQGFLAQEVEQAYYETGNSHARGVSRPIDGEEHYMLDDTTLIPNLVKAIKELKDENDALKARVEALES